MYPINKQQIIRFSWDKTKCMCETNNPFIRTYIGFAKEAKHTLWISKNLLISYW